MEEIHHDGRDDRDEFGERRRTNIQSMAADRLLARAAVNVTAELDRYHYTYMWDWLGLPIIQPPEDIVLMQEIIWDSMPQVVVETGVARGGSVILYSSIMELLGEGHVVGVDIDIRSHNRKAIQSHPLGKRVRLVEGSSIDPATLAQVRREIGDAERVMVVLDSDHSHDHVLEELRSYGRLVTPGQFLVIADTVLEEIPRQDHRPRQWGPGDNPRTALDQFLEECQDFEQDPLINGKALLSHSRGGFLRRTDKQ